MSAFYKNNNGGVEYEDEYKFRGNRSCDVNPRAFSDFCFVAWSRPIDGLDPCSIVLSPPNKARFVRRVLFL